MTCALVSSSRSSPRRTTAPSVPAVSASWQTEQPGTSGRSRPCSCSGVKPPGARPAPRSGRRARPAGGQRAHRPDPAHVDLAVARPPRAAARRAGRPAARRGGSGPPGRSRCPPGRRRARPGPAAGTRTPGRAGSRRAPRRRASSTSFGRTRASHSCLMFRTVSSCMGPACHRGRTQPPVTRSSSSAVASGSSHGGRCPERVEPVQRRVRAPPAAAARAWPGQAQPVLAAPGDGHPAAAGPARRAPGRAGGGCRGGAARAGTPGCCRTSGCCRR